MTAPTLATATCRVCTQPATRGWLDGWYCGSADCWEHRVWGRNLSPDRAAPGRSCPPALCWCGRCPTYRPAYSALPPEGSPAWHQLQLGAPTARRAAAAAARAALRPADQQGVQLQVHARPTSAAAARRVLPHSGTQRRRVLDALADAWQRGHHGATDPELQRHLGLLANSQRPRRVELVTAGLAHDTGLRRTEAGSEHTVWGPTNAALAALGLLAPDG